MLSYIFLNIIVCYLRLLDFIVCYLTNYWTLLYVISQNNGCHCLLSHKQLDVIACYLTNC